MEQLMHNVLEEMKSHYDFYRHRAYLKKMGWTEEAYQKQTDPDCNLRADRIKDYYHGYKHVHSFTTTRESPFTDYPTWMDAYNTIQKWCWENCQDKFRDDILRAHKQTAIGYDGDCDEQWFVNEIGGGDVLFFAFKSSKDYTLFCLRWS
jgi:hypothetical protein